MTGCGKAWWRKILQSGVIFLQKCELIALPFFFPAESFFLQTLKFSSWHIAYVHSLPKAVRRRSTVSSLRRFNMATLPPHELQYQLEHKGDNKKPDVIVSLAIMLAAAYLAVGLRFLSRRLIHAELSYDDWMMVVGVVSRTTCHGPWQTVFQASTPHSSSHQPLLQDAGCVSLFSQNR